MNLASIFTGFEVLIGPAISLADTVAQATGNQKLEAVTGALTKISTGVQNVESTASAVLPIVVSEFADLKHALEAAVSGNKPAAAAASA